MIKDTQIKFANSLSGEVYYDDFHQLIYATDASAYKEKPFAIVVPETKEDIKKTIDYARQNQLTVIPRTAGTSIAGQVVGNGIVVDVSKNFNKILEVNTDEKWVRIQPGVVLDELNKYLDQYNLFFGPETSTSNRCMLGGMVGNNSCGAHSLIYGSTRDHTLEINTILSDGSEVAFKALSGKEFQAKMQLETLEGELYKSIYKMLLPIEVRDRIHKEFPDPQLERRNTGYAIDILSSMQPFVPEGKNFNFCSLLCGSEGTLAFTTEIKLNLVPKPPKYKGLLVVHHDTIAEALEANIEALKHSPVAIELIDKFLLDCTIDSKEHSKNRFFLKGDPGALLCIELTGESVKNVEDQAKAIEESFKKEGFGFHFPLLFGPDISKVWSLRKAGLGLLSNIPGDAKPQPVIEDTAVSPHKLPDYIKDFDLVLKENNLECVYYAHIATGELHLRPVINLKTAEGIKQFRIIATEIARLVKKYRGSLSGEHGDGRLRGEFIPYMIGQENYDLLKQIKKIWDPTGVFNVGKITDTPPMDTFLRFEPDQQTPVFETMLDFSDTKGLVRMAEKCNGSADCRKSAIIGGTMCPSFQATKDERNTTRARANILREVLNSNKKINRFDSDKIYAVLDLCLSCKGCKTECPSGVDMAKLKSEFLFQYYKTKRRPIRQVLIANFSFTQKIASKLSFLYNGLISFSPSEQLIKALIGFASKRSLPKVNKITWKLWLKKNLQISENENASKGELTLFIDEFTNYNELQLGITVVKFLQKLGYRINTVNHEDSGRAKISKGFFNGAKVLAEKNVSIFNEIISDTNYLVGIEPSAILTFRDEYPDFLRGDLKLEAENLAKNCLTIEEFVAREIVLGNITSDLFTKEEKKVLYHGHCQQKALVGTKSAISILNLPENFSVEEIKSGCCGMAGSFGYEKEHFDLSSKIGELVLFPKIREAEITTLLSASGTSCRHHIKDGTGKVAQHPVEILFEALL